MDPLKLADANADADADAPEGKINAWPARDPFLATQTRPPQGASERDVEVFMGPFLPKTSTGVGKKGAEVEVRGLLRVLGRGDEGAMSTRNGLRRLCLPSPRTLFMPRG